MMDNQLIVEEGNANLTKSNESFSFSCVSYDANELTGNSEPNYDQCNEHELYFDMDITLPLTWGGPPNPSIKYHYIDSPGIDIMGNSPCLQENAEFEFSITISENGTSSGGFIGALSPADDLFYKGQLLPLCLPPRLRMVKRLSSIESNTSTELEEDDEEEDYESFDEDTSSTGVMPSIQELMGKERYPFSCEGSLVEEPYRIKKPNSSRLSTNGARVRMAKEGDASEFPDCYRDPALQMLQGDVYAKPSMGWRVLLPGSRRLSWQSRDLGCDLRRTKEAHKWGLSIIKLRASASFLKSFFHATELGRMFVHQKDHYRHNCRETVEGGEEEEGGHLPSSHAANCSAFETYGINKQAVQAANAQAERDKIIKRAKEYLQKYVRLFKSMYVSISHTHPREQWRHLLESSSSVGGMPITCRSSSCKTKKGIVNCTEPKPVRTTSFSKRAKRDGADSCIVDWLHPSCGLHDEGGGGSSSIDGGASCLAIENPIQGAIAHCKQSSSLSG